MSAGGPADGRRSELFRRIGTAVVVLPLLALGMLWAPPESMQSASPTRISSHASPRAWLLAAQAVRQL